MKTFEIEQGLKQTPAGRVALGDGGEIGTERVTKGRLGFDNLAKGLQQQAGIDRMLQLLRQTMTDRVL